MISCGWVVCFRHGFNTVKFHVVTSFSRRFEMFDYKFLTAFSYLSVGGLGMRIEVFFLAAILKQVSDYSKE